MMETVGFIMTRHVTSETTNKYWIECYNCIRRFYPKHIVLIIDDNSKYEYIKNYPELKNVMIINSEYIGRGELLPYFYFYQWRLFDKAVILHDSTFIQTYIDFNNSDKKNKDIQFLWHFDSVLCHDTESQIQLLMYLNHSKELIDFLVYHKDIWCGCYGTQSVISHDFLRHIVEKYNFLNLLGGVRDRITRCSLERVFAVVCIYERREIFRRSLLGNIMTYIEWDYKYAQYIEDKEKQQIYVPVVKVWTGR
jgi:hypothetical protein